MFDIDLSDLFKRNRSWAEQHVRDDPDFFARLARQQSPKYLWIGCADSRVPANEIGGLQPGEMFVHRNVANVVVHSDMNCLSVLEFAIDVLKVEHVIVVGHYGCAGIKQVLLGGMEGVADNWLRHVDDVRLRHTALLDSMALSEKSDLLVELNVLDQVYNVCRTTFVREAWKKGQKLVIHGWVYGLSDGLIKDLGWSVQHGSGIIDSYAKAVQHVTRS